MRVSPCALAVSLVVAATAVAGASVALAQDESDSDPFTPPEPPEPITTPAPVRVVPLEDGNVVVDGNAYPGVIEIGIADGALEIVDAADVEEILTGLEALSENRQSTWPAAAVEAQAIATRTQVIRQLSDSDVPDEIGVANVCLTPAAASLEAAAPQGEAQTPASQPPPCPMYSGLAATSRAGAEAWGDAIRATNGRVALEDGTPISARIHDTAGGRTRANTDVFGGEQVPYLTSADAPFEEQAPLYRWTATFELSQLDAVFDAAGIELDAPITDVTVEDTPDGSGPDFVVLSTEDGQVRLLATDFVDAVNRHAPQLFPSLFPGAGPVAPEENLDGRLPKTLPSAAFEADTDGDTATLSGRGYGHLVGMSQQSARGMAEQGNSADEIITHFFEGTSVGPFTPARTARVRVPLESEGATSTALLGSTRGFRIESTGGESVVEAGFMDWTVGVAPDNRLTLTGPPGSGAPLALSSFSVPLRADEGDTVPVTFAVSKPARVSLDVDAAEDSEDRTGLTVADSARLEKVFAAGEHTVELVAGEEGSYVIELSATDEIETVTTDRLTIEVEKSTVGPSALSALALAALLAALGVGVFVYRSTRPSSSRA